MVEPMDTIGVNIEEGSEKQLQQENESSEIHDKVCQQ